MISLKEELKSFPAIDLENLEREGLNLTDSIKNSIVLYNKAIESIRMGNEDIAIINLKKAVAMNPAFYEAVNLLGLCYAYIKEYDKAEEAFRKVIAAEHNSIKALRYLELIEEKNGGLALTEARGKKKEKGALPAKKRAVKAETPENETAGENKDGGKRHDMGKLGFKLLKYIGVFAAGAAFTFLLYLLIGVFPAGGKDGFEDDNTAKTQATEEQQSFEEEYEKLKAEYDQLDERYKKLLADADYNSNVILIYEAQELAGAKEYEKAADMLSLLGTASFKEEHKEKYEKLVSDILPRAAYALVVEGDSLVRAGKHKEALTKLEKAKVYDIKPQYMDRILYNIGKAYAGLNDSRNAVAAFQQVIDNYPKSAYAGYSRSWINSLTAKP